MPDKERSTANVRRVPIIARRRRQCPKSLGGGRCRAVMVPVPRARLAGRHPVPSDWRFVFLASIWDRVTKRNPSRHDIGA
jgi:hypothetical protein